MNSLMQFEGLAALLGLIGLVIFWIGFKLLANSSWLMGWLRGNLGIAFICLTGFIGLCVLDVRTYHPMFDEQSIATINFQQISPGKFQMYLVDAKGEESRYPLSGNTWQIAVNQFQWSKRLSLGIGHGYRFQMLISKLNSSQNEKPTSTINTQIYSSRYVDVWGLVRRHMSGGFLVTANEILTAQQPLVDGAMYELVPLGLEITVRPLNEIARRAVAPENTTTIDESSVEKPVSSLPLDVPPPTTPMATPVQPAQ